MDTNAPSRFTYKKDGASEPPLPYGTLLKGAWAQLLQWPAARRVESINYPDDFGSVEDLHGGLYDGMPRELRLPVYLSFYHFDGFFYNRFNGLYAFFGFYAPYVCTRVEGLTQLTKGWKLQLTLRELALPDWLKEVKFQPHGAPSGMPPLKAFGREVFGIRFQDLGVGCYGVRLAENTLKFRLPLEREPDPYKRLEYARGAKEQLKRATLQCAMAGQRGDLAELLYRYGAAFAFFAGQQWPLGRIDATNFRFFRVRYAAQRVTAVLPAERVVLFELDIIYKLIKYA